MYKSKNNVCHSVKVIGKLKQVSVLQLQFSAHYTFTYIIAVLSALVGVLEFMMITIYGGN